MSFRGQSAHVSESVQLIFSLFLHTILKQHVNAHSRHVQTPKSVSSQPVAASQGQSSQTSDLLTDVFSLQSYDYWKQVGGSNSRAEVGSSTCSCFCQTAGTPLRNRGLDSWLGTHCLDDCDCCLYFVGRIKYLLSVKFMSNYVFGVFSAHPHAGHIVDLLTSDVQHLVWFYLRMCTSGIISQLC